MVSIVLAQRDFDPVACKWKRYRYAFDGETAANLRRTLKWAAMQQEREAPPGSSEDDIAAGQTAREAVPAPDMSEVPPIDVSLMRSAAAVMVGKHDFGGMQARGGRSTTVRTIFDVRVEALWQVRVARAQISPARPQERVSRSCAP